MKSQRAIIRWSMGPDMSFAVVAGGSPEALDCLARLVASTEHAITTQFRSGVYAESEDTVPPGPDEGVLLMLADLATQGVTLHGRVSDLQGRGTRFVTHERMLRRMIVDLGGEDPGPSR